MTHHAQVRAAASAAADAERTAAELAGMAAAELRALADRRAEKGDREARRPHCCCWSRISASALFSSLLGMKHCYKTGLVCVV